MKHSPVKPSSRHSPRASSVAGRLAIGVHRPTAVYHVGDLDGPQIASGSSLEGSALSVSVCPQAWSRIAEIGGSIYKLQRTGGTFLDVHSVRGGVRRAILAWAQRAGYLERVPLYYVDTTIDDDDDNSNPAYSIFSDAAEAAAEAEAEADDVGLQTSRPPRRRIGWSATPLLRARLGFDREQLANSAQDAAVMAWAEDAGFDGTWWRETYLPQALSAPRGCIFQSRLPSWDRKVADDMIDDKYLRASFAHPIAVKVPMPPLPTRN